jgi:hypothetical protein
MRAVNIGMSAGARGLRSAYRSSSSNVPVDGQIPHHESLLQPLSHGLVGFSDH